MTVQLVAFIAVVVVCLMFVVHMVRHPLCPHCRSRYRQTIPSKSEPDRRFWCESCGRSASFIDIWNFNLL